MYQITFLTVWYSWTLLPQKKPENLQKWVQEALESQLPISSITVGPQHVPDWADCWETTVNVEMGLIHIKGTDIRKTLWKFRHPWIYYQTHKTN